MENVEKNKSFVSRTITMHEEGCVIRDKNQKPDIVSPIAIITIRTRPTLNYVSQKAATFEHKLLGDSIKRSYNL